MGAIPQRGSFESGSMPSRHARTLLTKQRLRREAGEGGAYGALRSRILHGLTHLVLCRLLCDGILYICKVARGKSHPRIEQKVKYLLFPPLPVPHYTSLSFSAIFFLCAYLPPLSSSSPGLNPWLSSGGGGARKVYRKEWGGGGGNIPPWRPASRLSTRTSK